MVEVVVGFVYVVVGLYVGLCICFGVFDYGFFVYLFLVDC